MATATDQRSAAELRAEKDARVAEEQAKLDAARERVKAEADAEAEAERQAAAAATNGGGRGGARMEPQTDLFEEELDNHELLKALDRRHQAKAAAAPLKKKEKEADEFAKQLIAGLDLDEETTYRCGPFQIRKSKVEARAVSFETDESSRVTIKLIED